MCQKPWEENQDIDSWENIHDDSIVMMYVIYRCVLPQT